MKGLTWVQEAWFIPESIPKLKVVDAEWMAIHWLDLKRVHVLGKKNLEGIPKAFHVLEDHGVSVKF